MISVFRSIDWILVGAATLLMVVSVLELYGMSALTGASFASRQVVNVALAIGIGTLIAFLDYRLFRAYSRVIYFVALAGLVAVLVIGTQVRGTVGWISIGSLNIQVVEFAKVALIVFLASFISAKQVALGAGTRLIASFVLTLVMAGLVLAQPDFGSTMILLSIWFGMLFVSGMRKSHLIALLIAVAVAAVGTWFVLEDYQKDRVVAFVQPELDPLGSGYNVIQSMVAVGAGGWTGAGLGSGTQTQLRFLPEKHTDFIFAVIAEEMGALGALFILVIYGVILWRLWVIARGAPTNFSYLLVSGVMIMIFVQLFINAGMNMGIAPVTGIPLPFVSYGGSSVLAMSIALGMAIGIHRRTYARRIAQKAQVLID